MRINSLTNGEFIRMFNRIYTIAGVKAPKEVLENPEMVSYLIDKIKEKYGETEVQTVETAFELLANNFLPIDISKNRTLTFLVFNRVMQSYSLKENGNQEIEEDEREPTEEEKQAMIKRGLLSEFRNFQELGMFFNSGNSTYEYLKKMGAFDSFTEEAVKNLKREAKNDFTSYQKVRKNPYMTAIGNGNTLEQTEGYHFVRQFFRSLRQIGSTMEAFLETQTIEI